MIAPPARPHPGQTGQRHASFLRAVPAGPRARARRGAGGAGRARRRRPSDAGVAFTGPFDARLRRQPALAHREPHPVARGAVPVPQARTTSTRARRRCAGASYFNAERTFKVETNAHRSPVKSLDFITLRVKDAIADQFREAIGRAPSVDRARSRRARARVPRREDLHALRRHQRRAALQARPARPRGRGAAQEEPRRGNPAPRGLEAGHRRSSIPMCGAGTFLSEAAEISLGRAAGRERDFGFEKLARFDARDVGAHARPTRRRRERARGAAADLRLRPLRPLARPRGA